MTLSQKQQVFTQRVGLLIAWAYAHGYGLTFGEAYRTPEQAKLNAAKGSGIANSLHTQRLAVDLMLFKDGKYLTDTPSYTPLGEYWESLSTPEAKCCWGGRFGASAKGNDGNDGNHFSLEHEGRK